MGALSGTMRRCGGRTVWPFVGFGVLFVLLMVMVTHWFLLPALEAYNGTKDPKDHKILGAHALALMAILLVFLGLFLVLMFRVSRFFFAEEKRTETKTKYVDAWAESAKRMKMKDEESET